MISKKEITRRNGRDLKSFGADPRYHDGGLWKQE